MKKKYTITLTFSVLLVSLIVYSFIGKKKMAVKRIYKDEEIIKLNFKEQNNYSGLKAYILNKSTIGFMTFAKNNNRGKYRFTYKSLFPYNAAQDDEVTFEVSENSDLKFISGDTLYFYNRFGLYEQFKENQKLLNHENVSVYDAVGLDGDNILCLGEIQENDGVYTTCFFKLNRRNTEIIILHVLNKRKESAKVSDLLIYAGKFQQIDNCLAYVFERQGEILFFESKHGRYVHSIHTVDETKAPKTVDFGNRTVFERGKSNLTNVGVLKSDSLYFVISNFPRIQKMVLFDVYEQDKYKHSLRIPIDDISSYDIRFVYQKDGDIYLASKKKIYSIKQKQLLQLNK